MMLFLTIVFLTIYLVMMIRGNPFSDFLIKVGEESIKKAEENDKSLNKDTTIKVLTLAISALLMAFIELIYLIASLYIDPYKYPTMFLLLYFILSLAFRKKAKKNDLQTADGRMEYRKNLYKTNRKYSLKGFVVKTVFLAYFGYMFYNLVFE